MDKKMKKLIDNAIGRIALLAMGKRSTKKKKFGKWRKSIESNIIDLDKKRRNQILKLEGKISDHTIRWQ